MSQGGRDSWVSVHLSKWQNSTSSFSPSFHIFSSLQMKVFSVRQGGILQTHTHISSWDKQGPCDLNSLNFSCQGPNCMAFLKWWGQHEDLSQTLWAIEIAFSVVTRQPNCNLRHDGSEYISEPNYTLNVVSWYFYPVLIIVWAIKSSFEEV